MANLYGCNVDVKSEDLFEFIVEYRGDFLGEIRKVDFACGYILNEKFAILVVERYRAEEVLKLVPSILYINYNSVYILEETSVMEVSNIRPIKNNPYLNIDGSGVLIGIADTGIDYLNKEFIREDDTSRIETIWDQTVESDLSIDELKSKDEVFIGKIFSNDQINNAIKASKSGGNPYDIVSSKDDIGHGTHLASISGASGYNEDVEGVANKSNFVIVKLKESATYKLQLKENNLPDVPVYDITEIMAGIEFLKRYAIKNKKPMVIISAIGTTDHSHDGSDLFSRYINDVASYRGIVFVTSCGNSAAEEGHASGYLKFQGDNVTKELNISKEIKKLNFRIWIRRPNRMALSIISPYGQDTKFIEPKYGEAKKLKFVYENTTVNVRMQVPDNITGLQVIIVEFRDIKPGIWRLILGGRYIVDGRFDIWLPPSITLPSGTKFLEANPDNTINEAGGARKSIAVGYYNQNNDTIVSTSGRGFPFYGVIKPDLAAPGIEILSTNAKGGNDTVSGGSVAAAIVGGCCALLLQWGIVEKNDTTMYSTKIASYLASGATRNRNIEYPSRSLGYGQLNLVGVFNNIAGIIEDINLRSNFEIYKSNNLYVRIPRGMVVNPVEI